MCSDMMDCLRKTHKKALRTLEKVIDDADNELNSVEIEKIHRLLDIIKDGEKMKVLYGNNSEKEE